MTITSIDFLLSPLGRLFHFGVGKALPSLTSPASLQRLSNPWLDIPKFELHESTQKHFAQCHINVHIQYIIHMEVNVPGNYQTVASSEPPMLTQLHNPEEDRNGTWDNFGALAGVHQNPKARYHTFGKFRNDISQSADRDQNLGFSNLDR